MLAIGIFPNVKKQTVNTVLEKIIRHLKEHSVKVLLPEDAAMQMGYPELACSRELIKKEITLGLTLGGDGTLLSTTRELAPAGIPLCGINMGQLGFLTEVELPELVTALNKLIKGDYFIEERLMMETVLVRNEERIPVSAALNDVVIAKGGLSRMIRLGVFIDGVLTAKYPADGLIISTPTGSTGYSLSAGGPIVNPNLRVILLTPICPHSLHARSLIISEKEEVMVTFQATHDDIALTVDGQTLFKLMPDDKVLVKRSPVNARFIKMAGKSYYQTLRSKLQGD